MAKKNGKGNVKVAQNNNNGGNNADTAVEAAAMLTTTGGSSMDRNHQVDLLKMAHDRFFLDEKADEPLASRRELSTNSTILMPSASQYVYVMRSSMVPAISLL